jgi:hypothetical protein
MLARCFYIRSTAERGKAFASYIDDVVTTAASPQKPVKVRRRPQLVTA